MESSAESMQVPESEPAYTAPLPDYAIPGMEDNPLGGVIALILGTILVLLVALVVTKLLAKRKENKLDKQ